MAKFYEVAYQPPSGVAANQALGQPQQQQQYAPPVQGPPVQQQPVYQQPVQQPVQQQGGYYAEVPPIGQLMAQPPVAQEQHAYTAPPVQQAAPVQAAPAAGPADLSSLPPEAQALVQRMLAAQQAG